MCMVVCMSTTQTRTDLLNELAARTAAGEDAATVLSELKARPEWELVAAGQGLR